MSAADPMAVDDPEWDTPQDDDEQPDPDQNWGR